MRDIITKLEQLNVEKEQLNEGLADMAHEAEKDHEVQMARSDCYKSAKYAVAIHKMLKDVSEMEGIDGWVAAKITKAADYLGSVKHYMEGQAMSDVELAVVPVAGDMTDAMTVPQESVKEVYENKNSVKHVDKLLSLAPQRTPGDIIADIMHWADANNMDIDEIVKQGKMYYNDDKFMFGDDSDGEVTEAEERDYICVHAKKGKYECSGTSSYAAAKKAAEHWGLKSTAGIDAHLADEEKTATESIEEVTEGRLGFKDIAKFGSAIASKIDMEARRRGSADMEPGDADELRYRIAKEMGLVEAQEVVENAERIIKVTNIDFAGPSPDKMQLPTSVTLRLNVPYDADEDDIDDMVADDLEDRYGVKVTGFETQFGESVEEDEDVIGNIIGKLAQGKAGQRGGKDVIGDIIAKLPKDSDEKTVNMPSLPKSKPERTPTVSAVAQQAAANKAVRSMGQDKTTGDPRGILRQSKFSEWSKK